MKTNNNSFELQKILEFIEFCKTSNISINTSNYNLGSDIIERFKKGNKIKIKKENKGKFTEYCNGKVTSECILRGKRSPDPKIRKRATFAANARKFKH